MKQKTTYERGKFKTEIHSALYKSENIRDLLLENLDLKSSKKVREAFQNHVQSHLFVDDTIEETGSFIFYDVYFPSLRENIKSCQVVMYAICHRDILETYIKEGFYGNRADILCQMIEDCLINDENVANSFGIGRLSLDSIEIYNSRRFYGSILYFSVPNFR